MRPTDIFWDVCSFPSSTKGQITHISQFHFRQRCNGDLWTTKPCPCQSDKWVQPWQSRIPLYDRYGVVYCPGSLLSHWALWSRADSFLFFCQFSLEIELALLVSYWVVSENGVLFGSTIWDLSPCWARKRALSHYRLMKMMLEYAGTPTPFLDVSLPF